MITVDQLKAYKRKAKAQRDNWKRRAVAYRAALEKIAAWNGGVGVKWPHEIAQDALDANATDQKRKP